MLNFFTNIGFQISSIDYNNNIMKYEYVYNSYILYVVIYGDNKNKIICTLNHNDDNIFSLTYSEINKAIEILYEKKVLIKEIRNKKIKKIINII